VFESLLEPSHYEASESISASERFEMSSPTPQFDLLIERENYRVCRTMPQREFVSFCRDRNIGLSDTRAELACSRAFLAMERSPAGDVILHR
jgi:hypothetical protein